MLTVSNFPKTVIPLELLHKISYGITSNIKLLAKETASPTAKHKLNIADNV